MRPQPSASKLSSDPALHRRRFRQRAVALREPHAGTSSRIAQFAEPVGLAEIGCTANQIAAVTGCATLTEVQRYTRAADRKRTARRED
jgi:hypothetical protein